MVHIIEEIVLHVINYFINGYKNVMKIVTFHIRYNGVPNNRHTYISLQRSQSL